MSLFVEGLLPLTAAVVAIFGSAFTILVDWAKERWRKRFAEQLKAAVSRQTLTYSDLQHVAERWQQDRQKVLQALRVLLSESLAEEDAKLKDSAEFIRKLLHEHQSREPYAELPENISLQLAALSPALTAQPNAVPQLASSLSELYAKNQREFTRQRRLAIWGFVVGILGLMSSLPGIFALLRT